MARERRNEKLSSRTERLRLTPRSKPYVHRVHSGLFLGYRRNATTPGVWIARQKVKGEKRYKEIRLGVADDFDDATSANAHLILDFKTAQKKTLQLVEDYEKRPRSNKVFYTIDQALTDYLAWYCSDRDAAKTKQHQSKIQRILVAPELKGKLLSDLTSEDIEEWMQRMAKEPALRSQGRDKSQLRASKIPKKETEEYEQYLRRRRSSANNYLSVLKAALNRAWANGKVESANAWERVKPFRGVSEARIRFLSLDETTRLINAAPLPFRHLVQGALHTAARYGELTSLRVCDFLFDSKVIRFPSTITKTRKPRTVPLTEDGVAFFDSISAGRSPSELMFVKSGGNKWVRSEQGPHMRRVCKQAKISPAISFHILRHTTASHLAMKGTPLQVIAAMLGHADTRITQKHYAHLCPDFVADVIRANLPSFGSEKPKVVPIRKKRHG